MINLLPNETKKQIYAARTNVILAKYLSFLIFSILFLVVAYFVTFYFLNNYNNNDIDSVPTNSQPSDSNLALKTKANTIRTNLSTAKNILDQQISISEILTGIAAALPSGVVIDSINIDKSTLGTPMPLIAKGSIDDGQRIKDGFGKYPSLFSKIEVISIAPIKDNTSKYTHTINFNVTINKVISI